MRCRNAEYHRQRAQELRAIAYFVDNRQKHETLIWLARDYERMSEHDETAGLAGLVRQLHILRIAEQLRPLGELVNL